MDTDREDYAGELHDEGRAAFGAGDLRRAVECLRAASALEPHYKTMEILGEALLRLGLAGEAIVWLAAAAGLSPKQARSRLLLAEALESRGEIRNARIQLEEALRVNPQYNSARLMLSRLPIVDDDGDVAAAPPDL